MLKKTSLVLLLLAVPGFATARGDESGAKAAPIVQIDSGGVRGAAADAAADVWVYRGLPYAAPPTGALRWREPQPPARWEGVREPMDPVPGCMQNVVGSRLPWTEPYMHHGSVSEDCLYLNVWTPVRRPAGRLQRARTSRQPAYAYYFEHAIPWPQQPQYGAFHSGELPYVFDNRARLDRPWNAIDRALAAAVSGYWVAFAATGAPDHAALAPWSPYRPGSMTFMVFADRPGMRTLE